VAAKPPGIPKTPPGDSGYTPRQDEGQSEADPAPEALLRVQQTPAIRDLAARTDARSVARSTPTANRTSVECSPTPVTEPSAIMFGIAGKATASD
jgi:hypothetical protein